MAGFALRFAHASNLRIDAPLRGVGTLPAAALRLAQDAPATAWEQVVEACIDRDVAFLLLTPRTAVGALGPFDFRVLLNGFRKLGEYGIPVYWSLAAGEALNDTILDELPDNVTLLTDQDSTATLIREGRVVATFGRSLAGGTPHLPDRLQPPATAEPPLRIRIAQDAETIDAIQASGNNDSLHVADSPLTGDYVACWGGTREQTRTVGRDLWVDPGSTGGRTVDEAGRCGINIVEWDGGSVRQVLRVPTATVVWHRCLLGVSPETTREELIERLQFALLEREADIGDQLWLIVWQIVGSGPEFEKLQAAAAQCELEAAVESVLGNGDRLQRVHRWDLRRRGTGSTDSVSQRLQEWLSVHAESECAAIANEGAVALRPAAVRDDAERLLAEWLATPNVQSTNRNEPRG